MRRNCATFRLLLLRVVVAAGAITTLAMAAQTVKYAATQADLIAALGNDTTVVLNNTILLESSTNPDNWGATGIVIENVKGLVIDGAGFAIDGQGKMRCLYVGLNSDVALIDTTVKNGYGVSNKASESKNSSKPLLPASSSSLLLVLSIDDGDATNHSSSLHPVTHPLPSFSLTCTCNLLLLLLL